MAEWVLCDDGRVSALWCQMTEWVLYDDRWQSECSTAMVWVLSDYDSECCVMRIVLTEWVLHGDRKNVLWWLQSECSVMTECSMMTTVWVMCDDEKVGALGWHQSVRNVLCEFVCVRACLCVCVWGGVCVQGVGVRFYGKWGKQKCCKKGLTETDRDKNRDRDHSWDTICTWKCPLFTK